MCYIHSFVLLSYGQPNEVNVRQVSVPRRKGSVFYHPESIKISKNCERGDK